MRSIQKTGERIANRTRAKSRRGASTFPCKHCRCRSPHAICPCTPPMHCAHVRYPSHARCPCTPCEHGARALSPCMCPWTLAMRPHVPLPCDPMRPCHAGAQPVQQSPSCASDLLIMHGAHAPRHASTLEPSSIYTAARKARTGVGGDSGGCGGR